MMVESTWFSLLADSVINDVLITHFLPRGVFVKILWVWTKQHEFLLTNPPMGPAGLKMLKYQQDYFHYCVMMILATHVVLQTELRDTCLTGLSLPRCSRHPLPPSPGCWAICCVYGSFLAGCGAPGRWWGGSLGWCAPAEACRSSSLIQSDDEIMRKMSCIWKLPLQRTYCTVNYIEWTVLVYFWHHCQVCENTCQSRCQYCISW